MGIYQLRLTTEQHQDIKVKAAENGKSMNQYILDCVDEKLGNILEFAECPDCGATFKDSASTTKGNKIDLEPQKPECEKKEKPKDFIKITPKDIEFKAEVNPCQKCLYPLKAIEHTCK